MKSNNSIEINGRFYDARSGKLIEADEAVPNETKPAQNQPSQHVRRVDGITKNPHHHPKHHADAKTTQLHINMPDTKPEPAYHKPKSHVVAPHAHSHPKRSNILQRTGVVVPTRESLEVAPEEKEVVIVEDPTPTIRAKFDDKRFKRAEQISRSPVISRFSSLAASAEPLNFPEPTAKTPNHPVAVNKTDLSEHLKRTHHTSEAAGKERMQKTKERLIERRLESAHHAKTHARSHPAHRQPRRGKRFGVASTVLVVLLLAGYVTYLNVPSLSMKLAASRAGFAATMPGQTPSGYSLKGPIAYSPGQVTINFRSRTDDRNFSLTQQPSTWDSTALLENYVNPKTSNYVTYQDRGLTVYVFNGDNAVWVNAGKLYKIEGQGSSLSSDQILSIATSM